MHYRLIKKRSVFFLSCSFRITKSKNVYYLWLTKSILDSSLHLGCVCPLNIGCSAAGLRFSRHSSSVLTIKLILKSFSGFLWVSCTIPNVDSSNASVALETMSCSSSPCPSLFIPFSFRFFWHDDFKLFNSLRKTKVNPKNMTNKTLKTIIKMTYQAVPDDSSEDDPNPWNSAIISDCRSFYHKLT